MVSKRYILLDWDGNLARTLDIWLEACRIPLAKRGVHLSDEELAASFGAVWEKFAEWGIDDVEQTINEMDEFACKLLPDVELYPDALPVLEELKRRGKQIALISTSLRKNVLHLVEKHNLQPYFDTIIAYEDVPTGFHKPHAAPLEKAVVQLGGHKDRAIMVGDSDKDLGAALNAGIDSILFYPEEHAKFYSLAELQKLQPTHTVQNFREILNLI